MWPPSVDMERGARPADNAKTRHGSAAQLVALQPSARAARRPRRSLIVGVRCDAMLRSKRHGALPAPRAPREAKEGYEHEVRDPDRFPPISHRLLLAWPARGPHRSRVSCFSAPKRCDVIVRKFPIEHLDPISLLGQN